MFISTLKNQGQFLLGIVYYKEETTEYSINKKHLLNRKTVVNTPLSYKLYK